MCLCVLSVFACGDDAGPAPSKPRRDAGEDEYTCVDEDGDGFGKYCDKGADCDDTDPNVTDLCRRCAQPKLDCPCKTGTMPLECDPPDMHVQGGTLVCSEGTRYCRAGFWSDCEIIGDYVFVAN
jgi:hypothetical protein